MNADAGRGNWLIVTLRLESGEELPFVVDTGCPRTILDKSLESKLGKQLGIRTLWALSGEKSATIYPMPRLYLGSAPLVAGSNVLASDLKKMSSHFGHSIMGVLGMDCLKNYCIQLDFAAGKMRFLDPDHLDTAGLGKAFPLELSQNPEDTETDIQLLIQHSGLFGGSSTNTVIDTGCNTDGAVKRSDIKKNASGSYSGSFLKRVQHFVAVEGMANRAADLPGCVWDGNTYSNIVVGEAPNDSPSWIGLRFLARHLVTFNFPKGMMYLKQTIVGPLVNEDKQAATKSLK
jgi:hypothetical protein